MLRIYGLLLLTISVIGGGWAGAYLPETALAWAINLGALLCFWILLDMLVSREGLATLGEVIAVDSLGKGVIVAAGGLVAGLWAAAAYRLLDPLYFLPVATLFHAFILFWILDFFLAGNEGWQRVRQSFSADHRPMVALLAVLGVVDILILSAVQREWGYLPPVITLIVLAGLAFAADRVFSRSRIWAVARHMVAEGVRMKIVLIFIVILLLLLPIIPLTVEGDGVTLTSRVQSFLSYTLGAVTFLLSLLTIFMACGALANEIRDRQIFMVASKPIPRWQFFFGKWLGIAMLNAGLLLLAGTTIWGFTFYLRSLPTTVPDDRERLENEVLNVRYAMKVKMPDIEPAVQERLRTLREEGRLEDVSVKGKVDITRDIQREIEQELRSHGPQEEKTYVFEGLIVDRESRDFLQLELKPVSPGGSFDKKFEIAFRFGDPDQFEKTMTEIRTATLLVERVNTLVCPVYAVNDEGTLYFHMVNLDPQYSMVFEGDDSIQLLFGLGTFHWNLFRALSIIWCKLIFLAVVGMFFSAWVSYPVAALATFILYLGALAGSFFMEAMDMSTFLPDNMDTVGYVVSVIALIAGVILIAWGAVSYAREEQDGSRGGIQITQSGGIPGIAIVFIGIGIILVTGILNPDAIVRLLLFDIPFAVLWLVPDFADYNPVGNIAEGKVVTLMWIILAVARLVVLRGLVLGILGSVILSKREVAQVSV